MQDKKPKSENILTEIKGNQPEENHQGLKILSENVLFKIEQKGNQELVDTEDVILHTCPCEIKNKKIKKLKPELVQIRQIPGENQNNNESFRQSDELPPQNTLKPHQKENKFSLSQNIIMKQDSISQKDIQFRSCTELPQQQQEQEQQQQNNEQGQSNHVVIAINNQQEAERNQQQENIQQSQQQSQEEELQNRLRQSSIIKEREKKAKEIIIILGEILSSAFCQGFFHVFMIVLALLYYGHNNNEKKQQELEYITIMMFLILDIFNLFKSIIVYIKSKQLQFQITESIEFVESAEFLQVYQTYDQNKGQTKYWLLWLMAHELITSNSSVMYFFKILTSLFNILMQICAVSLLFQNSTQMEPLARIYLIFQISEWVILIFVYIMTNLMICISELFDQMEKAYKKKQQLKQKQKLIKCLPKRHYKDVNKMAQDCLCSICLTDFEDNDKVIMLNCDQTGEVLQKLKQGIYVENNFHTFHEECLVQWLQVNKSCPYCRKQVILKNQMFKV